MLSKEKINLTCPECGKDFKASLDDLAKKKVKKCPHCGAEIKIDNESLSMLKADQKTETDFENEFDDFNRKQKKVL